MLSKYPHYFYNITHNTPWWHPHNKQIGAFSFPKLNECKCVGLIECVVSKCVFRVS